MRKSPGTKATKPSDTSVDPVTAYALAVTKKQIVAGPHVRAACRRHLQDLKDGPARGLVWDVTEVERVIGFFRHVLTVEIEQRDEYNAIISRVVPFILEPWQAFIVGSLFGWKNKEGFRRFRRAYVEVGKGNGKSPVAAGIGHYMLTSTGKIRAEVYSAATDKDQAAILFRDAVAMYERSPALHRRLRASGANPIWQLTYIEKGSFFKPISSEKKGKSGIRPYCALIDEVHEHSNNSVIEMLRAGTKGNQEALLFEITNSGFDRKSVCYSEHVYSVQILNGEQENDAWFSFIASLDDKDDPFKDESCWIKANPNLGVSIQPTYIREQVNEAKGLPSKEALVRRLHFCQWVENMSAAIPREVWDPCIGKVDPEALMAKGFPCFGGLDLSRVLDLSCFTLTWLLDSTKDKWKFASKTWFWTPLDTLLQREKRDRAPYSVWVNKGFIEGVPGPRISYSWVADALAGLCARYNPVLIGGDQYGLEQLQDHLTLINCNLPLQVHPQGFNRRLVEKNNHDTMQGTREKGVDDEISLWMPDSINKFEAALLEKRITIDENPCMNMCAAGVVYIENRTGHRMFAKDKALNRIDGMVSEAMSIGVATLAETDSGKLDDFLNNPVGAVRIGK